jgi:hypothetical protein
LNPGLFLSLWTMKMWCVMAILLTLSAVGEAILNFNGGSLAPVLRQVPDS